MFLTRWWNVNKYISGIQQLWKLYKYIQDRQIVGSVNYLWQIHIKMKSMVGFFCPHLPHTRKIIYVNMQLNNVYYNHVMELSCPWMVKRNNGDVKIDKQHKIYQTFRCKDRLNFSFILSHTPREKFKFWCIDLYILLKCKPFLW